MTLGIVPFESRIMSSHDWTRSSEGVSQIDNRLSISPRASLEPKLLPYLSNKHAESLVFSQNSDTRHHVRIRQGDHLVDLDDPITI